MWLFVGVLLGSMVTSSHETKEACEGRRVILAEKGAFGACHQISNSLNFGGTTTFTVPVPGTIQGLH